MGRAMKMNLINGDCIVSLTSVEGGRLLLTDIPYDGVNRADNGLRNLNKEGADVMTFDLEMWLELIYDKFDVFCIFCGNEQFSTVYEFFNKRKGTVRQLVYAKTNPSPMNGEFVYLSGVENAVWFKKRGTGKLNCSCKKNWFVYPCGSSKIHPTQKPLGLFHEIIEDCTSEGDLVVDCCMGSGTTGVACLETNRNFIGIELDKHYYEVACDRIDRVKRDEELKLF